VGGEWWWKSEKLPSEALRKAYEFDSYLVLTRVYRRVSRLAAAAPR
jgi:hypothetical protein